MWGKMIFSLARRMATTESGHKFLKGVLIGILCFLVIVPSALFEPIAGLVNGLSSFYSGEEGDDLDDSSDLDALIQGTLVISETKYYKQIMKIRAKHIKKIEEEQEKLADEIEEKYTKTVTYTYTDAEGNDHEKEREVAPEVDTPTPDPPVITALAYFCTTKEVRLADKKAKISASSIMGFYNKICKRPFEVTGSGDKYTVTVKYMSDDEVIELLRKEGYLKDEADEDLLRTSIERLTWMLQESGGYEYTGTPSGNISDTNVAKQIWDYFKGLGWTDYACAAVIGNFEAECSLVPNTQEIGGTGIGLGQWSHGRRTKFLSWMKKNGKDVSNVVHNCEYLVVENTWYRGTVTLYNSGGVKHTSKADSLSEFGTYGYQKLSDAVDDFLWHWESPNYKTAHQDRRQGAAQDAYDLFAAGGSAISGGSYAQIKQSYFPNGALPTSEAQMGNYLVTIGFVNSAGVQKRVTVHKKAAAGLLEALTQISEGGYEIRDIGGYVWKTKTNSTSGSRSSHSYGLAIDINPNYGNPQVKNGQVLVGTPYGSHELSMKANGIAVQTLKAYGWKWGGNWTSSKDYMHFSIPGD